MELYPSFDVRERGRIVASIRSIEERLMVEDQIERKGLEAGLAAFEVEQLAASALERTRRVKLALIVATLGFVLFALAAFRST